MEPDPEPYCVSDLVNDRDIEETIIRKLSKCHSRGCGMTEADIRVSILYRSRLSDITHLESYLTNEKLDRILWGACNRRSIFYTFDKREGGPRYWSTNKIAFR